jgi:hypothetical protein
MTNLSIYILKARYGRKLRDLLEFPKKKAKHLVEDFVEPHN